MHERGLVELLDAVDDGLRPVAVTVLKISAPESPQDEDVPRSELACELQLLNPSRILPRLEIQVGEARVNAQVERLRPIVTRAAEGHVHPVVKVLSL